MVKFPKFVEETAWLKHRSIKFVWPLCRTNKHKKIIIKSTTSQSQISQRVYSPVGKILRCTQSCGQEGMKQK